jgi:pilus assembly protein CpaF
MTVFGRRDVPNALVAINHRPDLQRAAPALDEPTPQMSQLRERVLKEIDPSLAAELTTFALQRQLEQIIHQIADEERIELSARAQVRLAEELAYDMTGLGPLEPLLQDDAIADVMVNGPSSIYVERNGKLERSNVRFRDIEHIMAVGRKIASRVGRRIDESSPMVDARLPDGSRVNVVFPPVVLDSPVISIRKFSRLRPDLAAWIGYGSLNPSIAQLLGIAARCRLNILISGGTGSGKTTLLNAMSQLIDHGERIISIEDAAELQLQQPHVIRMETRHANLEGMGELTQRDLVRNALRMRPYRIFVGEVRGLEAFDMLQEMITCHDV